MSRRRKRRHNWKTRGNYLVRTRKPHAPLGLSLRWLLLAATVLGSALYVADGWWWLAPLLLLFSGRHTAYVGQTSSRYHRDRQHRGLDTARGVPASPWSDLEPRWYPLPSLPWWKWSRELSEKLWTWLLCPVYPVPNQPVWNLRRISKTRAAAQRAARDKRRAAPGGAARQLLVDILVTCARLGLGIFAISVAYYLIMAR